LFSTLQSGRIHKKELSVNLSKIEEYSSNMVKKQMEYVKRRSKRTGSFLTDKQFKEVKLKLANLNQTKQKIIDFKR
jgi:histidyl-tRNA synthetase